MNSCESYQELISRLVDGEVSHDEHEALMDHMKTCSRCNAMYAVFHDLSDILSETPEELPEDLHENIMADVRRSDMRRRNRRMRTIGLRTALTAAACLVLVLFAASGFIPGRGEQDIALRSEQAAAVPEVSAAPAAVEATVPAALESAAPAAPAAAPAPSAAPAWTPPPVQNITPSTPDAYLASGDSTETQYNTPQPVQSFPYQPATPAPVYNSEPVYIPAPVYTPEPAVFAPPQESSWAAQLQIEAPAVSQEISEPLITAKAVQDETPAITAEITDDPAIEDGLNLFSLSLEDQAVFGAALPEELPDSDSSEVCLPDTAVTDGEDADNLPDSFELSETDDTGDGEPEDAIVKAEAPAAKRAETQRLSIHGKEARAKLLALLGGSEEALPQEAELTRAVYLTLVPEDEYSGEEKLNILVYGDFVFYELFAADGSVKSCRAGCSLADLDACLKAAAAAPTPKPEPAQDPYAAE